MSHRNVSLFCRKIVLLGLACLLAGLGQSASAATLTWDYNTSGGPSDGSGVWNTSTNTWWSGATDTTWVTADTAQFGSGSGGTAAYTVTLGTPGITAAGLIFQNQNYTLSGSTLTMGGAPTITMNASGTISSTLVATGGATTLVGTGALTLGGVANFTGQTFNMNLGIDGSTGTLQVVSGANVSMGAFNFQANAASGQNGYYIQTGGSANVSGTLLMGGYNGNGGSGDSSNLTVSGGTLTTGTLEFYKWGSCNFNVSGSGLVSTGVLQIGWVDSTTPAIVNLGTGGTLAVGSYTVESVRNATLNFNGGDLKANAGGSSWLPATTFVTAAVNSAGGIIDNGGYAITIGQALTHGSSNSNGLDGGMVIQGSGTTTLTGANTYTGGTFLNVGTLAVGNSSALGTGTLSIAANTALDASTSGLTLANNPQNWNGNFTFNGSNNLNMGTGTVAMGTNVQVTVNKNTLTVGGAISGGTNSLTLAGAGTLTLAAVNSYSGGTTISGGTLQANTSSSMGSGPLVDNGTLLYNMPNGNVAVAISGSGNVYNTGATGAININQSIALTNGNFNLGTTGSVTGTIGTIASGVNLSVGTGTGIFSVLNTNTATGGNNGLSITGVNSFSASGAGSITLGGSNSTTGGGAGGLAISGANLSTSGNITLSGKDSGEWGILIQAASTTINASSGTTTLIGNTGISGASKSPFFFGTGGEAVNLTANPGAAIVLQGGASSGTGIGVFNDYGGSTVFNISGSVSLIAATTDPTSAFWSHQSAENAGSPAFKVATGSTLLLNGGVTSLTSTLSVSSTSSLITIAGSGSGTDYGAFTINGGSLNYNISGTGALTQSGLISGSGALFNNGSGRVTLGFADTYSGGTTINAGVLAYGINNALPTSGAVSVSGGTLNLSTFTGSAGTVTLTNGAITGGTGTLSGASYNVQNGAITGILGGSGVLTKSTTGTVTVGAALTYTGSTAVNAGSLLLSSGSLNASSQVAVAGGATFGGNGSAGTATIAPGGILQAGNGASGTTNLSGLVFSGSGNVNIGTLANYASSPAVAVSGNGALSTSGTSTIVIGVASLAGDALNTPYELFSYNGSIGGTGSGAFQVASLPGRAIGVLSNPAGFIDLTITGSGDYLHWTGANSTAWDSTTANWITNSTSSSTTFINGTPTGGDTVVFDNTAGTNTSVSLTTVLYPSAITVASVNNYTFGGSGSIAGATALTMNGPGVLLISASNSYVGGTIINGGIVQVATASALGTGTITLAGGALTSNGASAYALANPLVLSGSSTLGDPTNNGPLTFTAGSGTVASNSQLTINSPVTINGALSGTGALNIASISTLTLTGSNIYTGATNVSGGTLTVNGSLASGSSVAIGAATLTGSGTIYGPTTLSGGTIGLSGGVIANTLGVTGGTWAGTGTVTGLVTDSANTFTINSGVLTASSGVNISGGTVAGAGSISGNATLASGAINFSTGGQITGSLTETGGSWNGVGAVGGVLNANGPLYMGSGGTMTPNGGVTFNGGNISGLGTIKLGTTPTITTNSSGGAISASIVNTASTTTINGPGALTIAGPANFAGQTVNVNGASSTNNTLQVASGANIAVGTLDLFQNGVSNATVTYIQTGGSLNAASQVVLGSSTAGGDGSCVNNVTVSGGTLTTAQLQFYKWATGNLTVIGSGVVNANNIFIGWVDTGTNGTVTIGDGLTFSGGTSIQNGGTSGVLTVGSFTNDADRGNTLVFDGGTLKASASSANWLPYSAQNIPTSSSSAPYFVTATVADAGGIIDNGGFAITIAQNFTHGGISSTDGGLVFQGVGTTTLTGAGNAYNGGTYVNSGVLAYGINNALPTAGAVTINGGTLGMVSYSGTTGIVTLTSGGITGSTGVLTGTAYNVQNGSISAILGGTASLTTGAGGVVALSGQSTYSGVTTINGSLLNVGSLANVNAPSAIGQGSAGGSPADLVINGGTLQYTGLTATSTNRLFTVASGAATLNASGGGSLTIGSSGGSVAYGSSSAPATLTLAGSGTGVLGANVGNSGTGLNLTSLVKTGPGTWVLTASNTYTGGTSINSGALYFNGANAYGSIAVAGSAILGGSGSASSATATVSNAGIVAAGYNGLGSLTLGGITFSSSGAIDIASIGNYASSPALSVTGALNTSGGSTVSIALSGPLPSGSGSVELIKYGSLTGSGTSAFVLNTSNVTLGRALLTLTYPAGYVDLNYSIDFPYWSGLGDGQWNTTSANNWKLNSNNNPTLYQTGDTVLFDDRAGLNSAQVVTISGSDVTPASVTFSNSTASYTLQGTNAIAGNATVTVNGGGLVTINNTNSYTGGTTLSAGTLNAGAANALGTGPVAVSGGVLNAAAINAFGSGPLSVSGGVVNVNAAQSIAAVALSAGTLNAGAIGALGSGTLGVSGGLLVSSAAQSVSSVTLSGGEVSFATAGGVGSGSISFVGNSTLQWATGNTQDISSQLVINSGVTATLDTQTNNVTLVTSFGGGGNGSLVKVGAGVLVLGANNTYGGGTTISGGTLQLGTGGAAGSPGTGPIVDNAALVYDQSSIAVNLPISGSGSVAGTTAGALTISQNIALTGGSFTFNSVGATIATGVNLSVGTGVGSITSISGGGTEFIMTGVNSLSASGTGSINLAGQVSTSSGGACGLNLSGAVLTTAGNVNLSGKNNSEEWGLEIGSNTSIMATSGTTTLNGDTASGSISKSPYLFIGNPTINLTANPGAAIVLQGGAASGTGLAVFNDYSVGTTLNISGSVSFVAATPDSTSSMWGQENSTNSGGGAPNFSVANGSTLLLNGGVTGMTTGLKISSSGSSVVIIAGSGSGTMSGAMAINGNSLDYNIGGSGTVTQSGLVSGTGSVTKNGGGTLILSNADSYTGGTTINNGTLSYGAANALPTSYAVNVNGGTLNVATYSGLTGAVTLTNGGITGSTGVLSGTFYGVQNGAITADLGDRSGTALQKTTPGFVSLSGFNAYAGGTTVSGGTLQVGSTYALGNSVGGLTVNAGVLDLGGYSPSVASLSGSTGVVTNNGYSSSVLDLVGIAATSTFSGSLRDGTSQVSLQLDGPMLTLAGTNTYSGATTINTGSLIAAGPGVLSANSAVTLNNGLLDVTAGSQSVASLTVNGGATLNLAINNVLSNLGGVYFGGTLNITGSAGASDELIAYPNVTYNGGDGTFANVNLNGTPLSSTSYTLVYNANQLDLVLPSGPPAWNATGGGGWGTPGNWSSGIVPTGQAAVAVLGPAALAPATITLDNPQTLGSLTFDNTNGYTLSAGSNGSLTMDNTGGAGDAQIVVLSGTHSIDATVTLTLAGSNTAVSAVNSGALNIAGNIADGTGNGTAALTFSSSDGTGLLTLSGTNAFGGGLYVSSGEVVLNGASSLLAGSTLTIGGGASGAVFTPPSHSLAVSPSLAPVPEPGTLALLAVLWTAVACYRFSKRRASRNT